MTLEDYIAGCPEDLRQELALVFMWAAHGVGQDHVVIELDRARQRYLSFAARLGMRDGRHLERQTVISMSRVG